MKHDIEAYTTDDGDPWAVFVHGEEEVTHELKSALLFYAEQEWDYFIQDWEIDLETWFADIPCETFYIRNEWELGDESHTVSEETPWYFCKKEDEGAVAVTGYKVYDYV